jgi:hypothetical protein
MIDPWKTIKGAILLGALTFLALVVSISMTKLCPRRERKHDILSPLEAQRARRLAAGT